jgi:hypothetical protein
VNEQHQSASSTHFFLFEERVGSLARFVVLFWVAGPLRADSQMRNVIRLLTVGVVVFLVLLMCVGVVAGFSIASGRVVVVANERFAYTGVPRHIVWQDDYPPVSLVNETSLRQSGVLIYRGEFGRLDDNRIAELAITCRSYGLTLAQGLSLRKQIMLTDMAFSSQVLKSKGPELSDWLATVSMTTTPAAGPVEEDPAVAEDPTKMPGTILELSVQMHQSPVSIMRAILSQRIYESLQGRVQGQHVRMIIKTILNEELAPPHLDDFLDPREHAQLQLAKSADVVGYKEQYDLGEYEAAVAWEGALYRFLDDRGVSYLTQDELQAMGCTRTPDCLLLDDVYINNSTEPVRWIDCKNFYGTATSKMFVKNLQQQINKYDEYFGGTGAIVYRNGFSAALPQRVSSVLLLDRGPLKDYDDEDDVDGGTMTTTTDMWLVQ